MKSALVAAAAAAALLAGSGCSGGSAGSSARPVVLTPQSARATFVVKISAKQPSSSVRRPSYVSADTKSVSLEVSTSGGASYGPPQDVNINLDDSGQCPLVNGTYACTANFTSPVGTVWLRVKAWSAADGTGSVLSQAVVPNQTILQNSSNDIAVTLNGVASTLLLVLQPASIAAGTASSFYAVVEGKDAAGDLIVVPPGTLTDANGDPIAPTLAADSYASLFHVGAYDTSNDRFDVDYNGDASAVGPIAFTAAASEYASATADLAVTPLPGLSLTPTSIQFLDLNPQSIAVAESGYGSGTFTITPSSGCAGVVSVPATVVAADGNASLPITPIAVGGTSPACTIVVSDTYGQTQSVTVTVTRTHGTIQ